MNRLEDQLYERYAELDQKVAAYREEMLMLEEMLVELAARASQRGVRRPAPSSVPPSPVHSRGRRLSESAYDLEDDAPPADPVISPSDDDDTAPPPFKRIRPIYSNTPSPQYIPAVPSAISSTTSDFERSAPEGESL